MSILAKKRKYPEKRKKNNLPRAKRILNTKMSPKRSPVFTFSLPGGARPPVPVSYATGWKFAKTFKLTEWFPLGTGKKQISKPWLTWIRFDRRFYPV